MDLNDAALKGIHPDLQHLAIPLNLIDPLPGNPRKGNVDAVVASYSEFGQLKPIVVRKNGDRFVVIAGNTQRLASIRLEWSHIACTVEEFSDAEAAAFAIADNRTHDLGDYDTEAMLDMISKFSDDDGLLEAVSIDLFEISQMEDALAGIDLTDVQEFEIPDEPAERKPNNPVIQYTIIFGSEDQQAAWFRFVRWLKVQYPELDTIGEKLDAYISGLAIETT